MYTTIVITGRLSSTLSIVSADNVLQENSGCMCMSTGD